MAELTWAARNGNLQSVTSLLDSGVNINQVDGYGRTALIVAAREGHLEVVHLLLEKGSNVNHADEDGWTALIRAAVRGHLEMVHLLLEKGAKVDHANKRGWTALIWAARGGHLEVVNLLLEKGSNVNHATEFGETALIVAASKGHLEVVNLLLEKGSNVNHADVDGMTALIRAALSGHLEVVKVLLEKGSNVNHADKKGKTAEQCALDHGHTRVAQVLKEKETEAKDREVAQPCLSTDVLDENAEARSLGFQAAKDQLIAALHALENAFSDERESSGRLRQSLLAKENELQSLKQERDTAARDRDAAIRDRDAAIRDRDAAVSDRDSAILDRDASVRDRDAAARDRETASRDRDDAIRDRDAAVSDRDDAILDRDASVRDRDAAIRDCDAAARDRDAAARDRDAAVRDREDLSRELQSMQQQMQQCEVDLRLAQNALDEQRSQSREWVIDRNEIMVTDRTLGRGAWGSVKVGLFRGTEVAVKQIHQLILSPYNRRLFEREMNIAARCRHSCLLQFIGATCDDGYPLFVTEILEIDLRQLLTRESLQLPQIVTLSLDIARAMAYLHGSQPAPIIHRDISSSNVLMWRERDTWRGKLSDYGAANIVRHTMTCNPGAVLYSAPEAGTSEQTSKLDVFSFGVLLCETCIRELPLPENRQEQILRISWQQCRDLVNQCVQVDPQRRPDSLALVNLLSQWHDNEAREEEK